MLYWELNKYKEAENLHRRAISISERILGKVHSKSVLFKLNFAQYYFITKNYHQAEKIYLSSINKLEKNKSSKLGDKIYANEQLMNFYKSTNRQEEEKKYEAIVNQLKQLKETINSQ